MFQIGKIPNLAFGTGAWEKLATIAKSYGKKVLLVTGKSSFVQSDYSSKILDSLAKSDLLVDLVSIDHEPLVDDIDSIVDQHKDNIPDMVVSIGGGSVIDAGKAIAAMFLEEGAIKNFLEGVGDRQPTGKKVPFIAMPTTAGTGSEATKNAVISKMGAGGFKKSLRHNNYIPDYVIISPELAVNCPPAVTAASGMDALTQLVESYISSKSNSFTDMLALQGIEKIFESLETVVFEGMNVKAREKMGFAAYLSGITLANAGLGVVHGFAQPLGSLFPVPHGVVCGTLMGIANRITLEKAIEVDNLLLLNKIARLGKLVSNEKNTKDLAIRFIEYIEELIEKLRIPKLGQYGITESDIDLIIKHTGLKNHPIGLNQSDLERILRERR